MLELLRILFRKPPFSVVSSMDLTFSTLRGRSVLSVMFFTSCLIPDGKFCHSFFKILHILSAVCNKGCPFRKLPGQKHIHQIFQTAHVLQSFYKTGGPCFARLPWGIFFLPAAQEMVIIGQHTETVPIHPLKFLFLGFQPQPWSDGLLLGVPSVLIGDRKVLCQHKGGFLTVDTVEP